MHSYIKPLALSFEKQKNAERAAKMKKYMRGQYEYFGIAAPQQREIIREFLNKTGKPSEDILEDVVKSCWEQPQREFQYFAMLLLQKFVKKAEICRVDLYEYLVLDKSWWDTIDFIAANLVGPHFIKFPDSIVPYTEKWMDSGNRWLQRTAILFQLKYKKNTDLELLDKYIIQLAGSKEFFINKAIGWILREYSKTDANWVKNYVAENETILANLSQREALKWLERKSI